MKERARSWSSCAPNIMVSLKPMGKWVIGECCGCQLTAPNKTMITMLLASGVNSSLRPLLKDCRLVCHGQMSSVGSQGLQMTLIIYHSARPLNGDRPPVSACERNGRLPKKPVKVTQVARARSVSGDRFIDSELRRISRIPSPQVVETVASPEPAPNQAQPPDDWA